MLSQILPEDRMTTWNNCGLSSPINQGTIYYFDENGGNSDGISPNDDALRNLIETVEKPASIIFGNGIYLFANPITLASDISLLGSGYEQTTLLFQLIDELSIITANGKKTSNEWQLNKDISKNHNTIEIPEDFNANIGAYYYLYDDDSALITSDWAKNTAGQLIKAINVSDGIMEFEPPLRRSLNNPIIYKYEPIENIKISGFKIISEKATDRQTSNMKLTYAVNCEICCNESENCNFAHIDLRYSRNIYVRDNYVHHAHSYGGGGKGYGVVLHSASSDNLIEDNIFEHLRHSVLIQSGGNANVVGYNYSFDPYWTDVTLPEKSAGDLVLHGNYPYLNLFEGNIVQNIVIDDSHGKNGPYNTFFRNRAELYGIFMNFSPPSDSQNFIANEITNTGFLKGLYMLTGGDHFEYANNVKGEIIPEGSEEITDISYYYDEIPEKYEGLLPQIGLPNELNENSNLAYARYKSGELIQCENILGIKEHKIYEKFERIACTKSELLQLVAHPDISNIRVYDIEGREVRLSNTSLSRGGIYLIKIEYWNAETERIIVIIQ